MLTKILTEDFELKISKNLCCAGKFDGKNLSIIFVSPGGKVYKYSPFLKGSENEFIELIDMEQEVISITCNQLDPSIDRDLLIIGTKNKLLLYDVEKNSDLFYQEISDEISTIISGYLCDSESPYILAGENCLVQGFDYHGDEVYWITTGDKVTNFAIEMDKKKNPILYVSSEDSYLRCFKNDQLIQEIPEQGLITNLCSLGHNTISYSMENGEIGVYSDYQKKWSVKTKYTVNSLIYPKNVINGLCIGYNNGLIELRDIDNGKLLFSNTGITNTIINDSPVAGFIYGDFTNNEEYSLIELTTDGKIIIYKKSLNYDHSIDYQNKIYELTKKKQDLLLEHKTLKERSLTISSNADILSKESILDSFVEIQINQEILDDKFLNGQIVLIVVPKENVTIDVINVSSIVLFEDNTFTIFPKVSKMQPPFHVPINFVHEIKGEISIKLLCQIRTKEGNINRVYDKKLEIPEFIMFKTVKNMDMDGVSNLKFTLNCKILDVVKWMKNNFLIKKKEDLTETFSSIRGNFIYLPDGSKISITAQISDDSLISVTIFTENLEIAGRCFQHLISVTDPSDINVVLRNFPTEKQKLIDILSNIEDFNVNRMKLSTEIATLSDQLVRFFILAEDSKEINDIQNLRKGYYAINNLNHDIFLEYSKRSSNHEQLVNALKDVNKIIHKAANLRYGKEKTAIISEAREAIKNNTISVLTNLLFD
ncbi:hypothetical protein H8356DRAFT_985190 [Neocallimastix lanati (nom. inval.)]|uniref:Bardet-Biedl syndrome 2 protein homolog n=1 Tax=Neocallimastix californiae TaxID=1754190 RepID=A0A1Y2AXF0_9FUNG|nr:hypothetical protein H8356DRAFT_985190 [Neocallimastix sp. JGI-2020a]ORY27232.1 hypothetical protein LY90DRAFT_674395 [Neocallimastix californiae]|eukprot:ORY27232.1 hypothetical protein LY90DRAFT_674395 [Neocallimastix californiae]